MNRHSSNFLIFVLACALYAVGFGFGAVLVIGLVVLLEISFWARLLRGSPPKQEKKDRGSDPLF